MTSTPSTPPSFSRRTFLTMSAAGVLTAWLIDGAGVPRAHAVVAPAQPSLAAGAIPQFVSPLFHPPLFPGAVDAGLDAYGAEVVQVVQQVLPAPLPVTTVWTYVPTGTGDTYAHWPAATIEATVDRPVQVRWRNRLVDSDGRYLPHLFAVDPTLHWANPEQRPDRHTGEVTTDAMPDFSGLTYVHPSEFTDPDTQYTAYTGPVPVVMHLHGAMGLGDESDGYPEAWVLPDAADLPEGYARQGRWHAFFAAKHAQAYGESWGPDEQVSRYPNTNRAATLWSHDHALGLTRLNVYAGITGFYLLRGGDSDLPQALDVRTGAPAVIPGGDGDRVPEHTPAEFALAIQDRSFNQDGSLFYPDSRNYFDGEEAFIPHSDIPPIWVPEFFGNTLVVNGQTWPYAEVEQRRYRVRLLNGCNARTLYLDLRGIPGLRAHLIGNETGLLPEPVDAFAQPNVPDWQQGLLVLGPAERQEIILDFGDVPTGEHLLGNSGPDVFFFGGEPGIDFIAADPATTGRVLQFRVAAATAPDLTTPADQLLLPAIPALPTRTDEVRRIALDMHHSHEELTLELFGRKLPTGVTTTYLSLIDGEPGGRVEVTPALWSGPIEINPQVGSTEIWEVYNWSVVPHPFHVHEVAFEVIDRQQIAYDAATGEITLGETLPVPAEYRGRKETIMVGVGEVVRIRLQFTVPGQFVVHCHLLEHEDNEMMIPFRVGPAQPGQPVNNPVHPVPTHTHATPTPTPTAETPDSSATPTADTTAAATATTEPTSSTHDHAGPSTAGQGPAGHDPLTTTSAAVGTLAAYGAGLGALAAGAALTRKLRRAAPDAPRPDDEDSA